MINKNSEGKHGFLKIIPIFVANLRKYDGE